MASSSSSSSTSAIIPQSKYDVFLSFRGEDTRHSFTSHLYGALCRKKILAFIDDRLRRGDEISQALLETIEASKISVVIFSKDYASSKWCLDELARIIECKEKNGQVVIPVFYHIDPSDVRKQNGSYKAAFAKHEKQMKKQLEQVQRWRNALTQASNLSGWDSMVTRPESKLVDQVVEDILKKLNDMATPSSDLKGLVGLNSRVGRIKSLLCIGSLDFRVVGIWGMGGFGKTTLAGIVYDQLSSQFEGHCFAINVREESEKHGLVHVREQILSQVLGENIKLSTPTIPQYAQERIRRKNVFLVLDDVNRGQLEVLAGFDQFGQGSRIIITTREKQVLISYGVHNIYEVKELNSNEALQLFCSHAFKQSHPLKDFVELSNRVVDYAKGNPLALKVLGSSLCGNISKQEWESALNNLNTIYDPEIHDLLKVGYEKLSREEKNIFLDIACFFIGEESDHVTKILDACYLSTHFVLSALIKKSLIIISDNKLKMHDLLQEMGREIVHRESEKKPGERSRLWYHDDIYRVFRDRKGTDAVEGIFLDMSRTREVHLSSATFSNMVNLRLLKFYMPSNFRESADKSKVHISEDLKHLPYELRYLHWEGYPLETMPSEFILENLVELALPHSNLKQLWKGTKDALKLKLINLSYSKHLTEFPNLSNVPKLEHINLLGCKSLLEVPSSIQYFTNLHILNLSGCESLRSFPSNIHFRSPLTLNLSDCINLTEFPQISGNVKYLYLNRTAIEEVPSSIACLPELVKLEMKYCSRLKSLSASIWELKTLYWLCLSECSNLDSVPSSICSLTSLRLVMLNGCSKLDKLPENVGDLTYLERFNASRTAISKLPSSIACWKEIRDLSLASCNLTKIPEDLCLLSSLEDLNLGGNNFDNLPTNMKQLSRLRFLFLRNCKMLQSIPELTLGLKCLDAWNCKQLQSLPKFSSSTEELDESELEIVSERYNQFSTWAMGFIFINCLKLNPKSSNTLADSQQRIQHMATAALQLFYRKELDKMPRISFCLPGSEIPEWFSHQSMGSSINIELSQHDSNKRLIGFALSAIITFEERSCGYVIEVKCKSHIDWNCFEWDCPVGAKDELNESDHIILGYSPCIDVKGDYTNATFEFIPLLIPHVFSLFKVPYRGPQKACKMKCCGVHPLYAQLKLTESDIAAERFAATDENLGETMLANCSITNGHGNGRSNEEVVPHDRTDCSLEGCGLLLLSCWNFILSFFRGT